MDCTTRTSVVSRSSHKTRLDPIVQTSIADFIKDTPQGLEADAILRSCVHCGFCTATCPTYQLLGDELDGPRGRIYLIKSVLEGSEVSHKTQLHLDRCLTCRSCETTCPSGVRYAQLLDIGRNVVDKSVVRPWRERSLRRVLRVLIPHRKRFAMLLGLARLLRPLLPRKVQAKVAPRRATSPRPLTQHRRRMLVLEGCVQASATPNTNAAAARVLDKLGVSLINAAKAGCCGAMSYHLSAHEEGLAFMRRNIDAWWPHIEQGVEAILISASGCGAMVKEYGEVLKHDPNYATKAARVSDLAKDLCEVMAKQDLTDFRGMGHEQKVAFHSPCTLQHDQQLTGVVEAILSQAGFKLTPVADSHLCCGSAGTYSILQGELSQQLLENKLGALQAGKPDAIATANIGCQLHLESKAQVPVKHWIELLDGGRA